MVYRDYNAFAENAFNMRYIDLISTH